MPATEFQSFPAPTVGAFGAAKTWTLSRRIGLLTTADFNHPSDNQESFRLGAELGLNEMLFLRGGYETSRDEGGFAAGFGLQLKRKQFLLRIDYAYSDMGSFGTIHHISVDLSPLIRSARTRMPGEGGDRDEAPTRRSCRSLVANVGRCHCWRLLVSGCGEKIAIPEAEGPVSRRVPTVNETSIEVDATCDQLTVADGCPVRPDRRTPCPSGKRISTCMTQVTGLAGADSPSVRGR